MFSRYNGGGSNEKDGSGQSGLQHSPSYRMKNSKIFRIAVFLTLVALLFLGGFRFYKVGVLRTVNTVHPENFIDFKDYCRAAIRYEKGENIYALDIEPRPRYIYPPIFAAALSPIVHLGFEKAKIIWLLGNAMLALAIIPAGAVISSSGHRLRGALLMAVFVLNSYPVHQTLFKGQVDLIIAVLVIAGLLSAVHRYNILAGLTIGLAISIKLSPVILLLPLAIAGRWKAFVATILSLLFWTLLGLSLCGVESYQQYFGDVLPALMTTDPNYLWWENQSMYSVFGRLFVDHPYGSPLIDAPAMARWFNVIAVISLVMWLVWRLMILRFGKGFINVLKHEGISTLQLAAEDPFLMRAYAATMLVALVSVQISWVMQFCWAVLPLFVASTFFRIHIWTIRSVFWGIGFIVFAFLLLAPLYISASWTYHGGISWLAAQKTAGAIGMIAYLLHSPFSEDRFEKSYR